MKGQSDQNSEQSYIRRNFVAANKKAARISDARRSCGNVFDCRLSFGGSLFFFPAPIRRSVPFSPHFIHPRTQDLAGDERSCRAGRAPGTNRAPHPSLLRSKCLFIVPDTPTLSGQMSSFLKVLDPALLEMRCKRCRGGYGEYWKEKAFSASFFPAGSDWMCFSGHSAEKGQHRLANKIADRLDC